MSTATMVQIVAEMHRAGLFADAVVKWRDISTAPKDGSLLRLLVEFEGHATEDQERPSPTIGANSLENTGVDEWLFAGWCWTHDRFTQGIGKPIGWLPMFDASQTQSDAVRDVLAERARQVTAEGWTHEHDDGHVNDEIAALACFYAMPPGAREWPATETGYGSTLGEAIVPDGWTSKEGDRRLELVKAGALILAEIERLDRATPLHTAEDATCTKCGCTDSRACPGGCSWLHIDREERTGLCSSCAPVISAEEVKRNDAGQWWHSALSDWPDDTSHLPLIEAAGLEYVVVTRDEAPQEVQDRLDAEWDGDFSFWGLQPPAGEGWFLFGAYDTEDGPVQCWARPSASKRT